MYKKNEKKETPFGWDSFNQKALYNAYDKRASKVCCYPSLLDICLSTCCPHTC
jgi:hypothetical protein